MKKIYFSIFLSTLFCLTAKATNHTIQVNDFAFVPDDLTVMVGDTIRWIRNDATATHTTTSATIPTEAMPWDETINASNTSFSYKVAVAGEYDYVCTPHQAMGMVGSFTATGTSAGEVEPKPFFSVDGNVVSERITVRLHLASAMKITLQLRTLTGTLVETLDASEWAAGDHAFTMPVSDLPKGLYLLEVVAENRRLTRRVFIE